MINSTTLPISLKKLQLNSMQSCWQETAEQAEKQHWSYEQYLAILCDREIAGREQRRMQRRIEEAKLPRGKSLDSFEFNKLASVSPAQITALAENTDWVKQAYNVLLFGPSGVGKTHLAAAIGKRLAEKGLRVFFAKTTTIVQSLQQAHKEHKLSDAIAKLSKFDLLILDDIGYVQKNSAETSVLFELISDRYENKSILITSNHSFNQWNSIFPSEDMAVASVDRLIHYSTIIHINEQSYRRRSKERQENLIVADDN